MAMRATRIALLSILKHGNSHREYANMAVYHLESDRDGTPEFGKTIRIGRLNEIV